MGSADGMVAPHTLGKKRVVFLRAGANRATVFRGSSIEHQPSEVGIGFSQACPDSHRDSWSWTQAMRAKSRSALVRVSVLVLRSHYRHAAPPIHLRA